MRALVLSLCLAGIATPAIADDDDYYYAGLQLGLTDALDEDLEGLAPGTLDIETRKKLGIVGGLYFGRNINKWRYELEYALRTNNINTVEVTDPGRLALATGSRSAEGSQQSDSLMANAHYNFAEFDGWKAYAGLGIGMSLVQLDRVTADNVLIADSRNWEPAGQAMVQLTKAIGGIELGLGVRHFRTLTGKFGTEALRARHRFANNEVFARVSWKFGEKARPAPKAVAPAPTPKPAPAPVVKPAPAPTPAPAPEPKPVAIPGPFMVFFDFDKSTLTADARSIIERAARAFKQVGAARITASGHADRSGADAYNEGLAERRAHVVRDALIAQGVSSDKISIRSFGETSPLVKTQDGVREWQNRRVEIVLSR